MTIAWPTATFSPLIAGQSRSYAMRVRKNRFGGGYQQRINENLNQLDGQFTFTVFTNEQVPGQRYADLEALLRQSKGVEPYTIRFAGESIDRTVVINQWKPSAESPYVQMVSIEAELFNDIASPAFNAEGTAAAAALTRAGATITASQNTAISNLIAAFKASGTWDKYQAIYPFVGGTAAAHAVNIKHPGIFTIDWVGAVTHNASGVTGAGGFGNTGYIPVHAGDPASAAISVYTSAKVAQDSIDIGGQNPGWYIYTRWTDNRFYSSIGPSSFIFASPPSGLGWFVANRTDANTHTAYRNGAQIGSISQSSTTLSTSQITVLAYGGVSISTATIGFATIGRGLTATEVASDYAAIQAFQTALGRAV